MGILDVGKKMYSRTEKPEVFLEGVVGGTKGLNIHGPTFQQKLRDNVHDHELFGLPFSYLTSQVKKSLDKGQLTDWGVPQDISFVNQAYRKSGAKTPQTSSLFGYGPFIGKDEKGNPKNLTDEEIMHRMREGNKSFNVKSLTGGNRNAYGNLVDRNLLEKRDEYGKRIPVGDFNDFEEDPYKYSLTRNVSSDINLLKELELASQDVAENFIGDSKYYEGLLGMDMSLDENRIYLPAESGFSFGTYADTNNGELKIRVDPENIEAGADSFNAYKPDEYKAWLETKERLEKNPNSRGAIARYKNATKNLLGVDTVTMIRNLNEDGTYSAVLQDGLFKDHVDILKNLAADNDPTYGISQGAQLAIEFLPGIGLFSGTFKGIGLTFKAGGKLTKESIAKLTQKGVSSATIKAIEIKKTESIITKYAKGSKKPSITKKINQNKKIFDYLDNLKEGEVLNLRGMMKELNLPEGSRPGVRKIIEKFYPNPKFIRVEGKELQKLQSEEMIKTFAFRRAETDVTVPTPYRVSGQKVSEVAFPKGMEEKYWYKYHAC